MTDASGLTPQQEVVRRLLADARHDQPAPPEVVARLEETLASLASERADAPQPDDRRGPAPVIDLGARRRRAAGIAALAAAAVVVAGVAIGQGLPRMQGSADSGASAGAGEDSTLVESPQGADDGGTERGGGAFSEVAPESLKSTQPRPERTAPTLSADDADLDDKLLGLRPGTQDVRSGRRRLLELMRSCDLDAIGRGDRVVVVLDGETGVVVFRRPDAATQQADLYVCGTPAPVRTVTLRAP